LIDENVGGNSGKCKICNLWLILQRRREKRKEEKRREKKRKEEKRREKKEKRKKRN